MSSFRCAFAVDGPDSFFIEPSVDRFSVTNDTEWEIDYGAVYCANDAPNPCLRWTIGINEAQHTILCHVKNNKQTWEYKGAGKFILISLDSRNSQQPIRAFCDEYGCQFKSRLSVKGTLRFTLGA